MKPTKNYEVLLKVYKRLQKNPNDNLKGLQMFHSSVGYVQAAIKSKFNKYYSYKEVANMMVEEELVMADGLPVKLENLVTNLSPLEKQEGFQVCVQM
jgi:hypothetical protein